MPAELLEVLALGMRLSACNDMACVLDRKLSGFNCSTSGLAAVPRVHAKQQAFQAAAHRSSRRAHQTPRQPSQCIATRWPLAVVRSAAGQQQDWQHLDPDDEPGLPWSVESLITLMEKFVSSGLVVSDCHGKAVCFPKEESSGITAHEPKDLRRWDDALCLCHGICGSLSSCQWAVRVITAA